MAYDFKKLADVSKDDTVPENGNVLYEEGGEIKKAPIKQDEEKKIKYITGYYMAASDGKINGVGDLFYELIDNSGNVTTDEDSAVTHRPVFFDGSNIPYIPNSGEYTRLKAVDIIRLYDEGYEIRVCTSVAFMESSTNGTITINNNKAPSCFKNMLLNKEAYKGWSPLRLHTTVPYTFKGSDFVLSKEGQTMHLTYSAPYLEAFDGTLAPAISDEDGVALVNEDLL